MWTRVISVSNDHMQSIQLVPISNDLKLAESFPSSIMGNISGQWSPLFYPRKFAQDHPDMSLERFALS
jgi:hypothetical protein